MYWTSNKLRLACRTALERAGQKGIFFMDQRIKKQYAALFGVGNDLVLAVIDNIKAEQLSIGLKKFTEMSA